MSVLGLYPQTTPTQSIFGSSSGNTATGHQSLWPPPPWSSANLGRPPPDMTSVDQPCITPGSSSNGKYSDGTLTTPSNPFIHTTSNQSPSQRWVTPESSRFDPGDFVADGQGMTPAQESKSSLPGQYPSDASTVDNDGVLPLSWRTSSAPPPPLMSGALPAPPSESSLWTWSSNDRVTRDTIINALYVEQGKWTVNLPSRAETIMKDAFLLSEWREMSIFNEIREKVLGRNLETSFSIPPSLGGLSNRGSTVWPDSRTQLLRT